MIRARTLAALAFASLAASAAAQTVTTAPADRPAPAGRQTLPVHVGGRVKVEPLALGTAFVHEWPGVYFEARFRGDRVTLRFDDPANEYRLTVDDLPPVTLAQPGRAEVDIGDIGTGEHRLRLEKVTESIALPAAFDGFFVPGDAQPLTVAPRPRQIEFIGDSNMAGYGIRSATIQCTKDEVRLRTDTQQAYPAQVARHFDADYQVNAISGRGMVRNYGGELPGVPLPAVYPRALPGQAETWDDRAWQPQVIVIGLFANDFSTPLKPGEKWADDKALIADYVASYGVFLAELHRRAPGAAILAIWPDLSNQPDLQTAAISDAAQARVAEAAHAAGIGTILFPVLGDLGLEQNACDYHGNLADHRKLTAWLTAYLENHPELWQGR